MLTAKDVPMNQALEHSIPKLHGLPLTLPRDGAVKLELEEGVLIFRVSEAVQDHIEALLHKQLSASLSVDEAEELHQYEDIDDYLSFTNRMLRNLAHL
jgi:hypothetical protein